MPVSSGPVQIDIQELPGHPAMRAIVDFGGRLLLYVLTDGSYVVRHFVDADEIQAAVSQRSLKAWTDWWLRRPASIEMRDAFDAYSDLTDVLVNLRDGWEAKSVATSPRQVGRGDSINRVLRVAGDPDERLCRDEDCDREHVWLVQRGSGREFSYVWHLNLQTCRIVPPEPLTIGR